MIKYLSLFSGIGAFEKALQRLEIPYELVGYCEINKYASKAYSLLHSVPESMNFGDITQLDETQLPDDIDLITYGFPCQDILLAGQQKGLLNDDGTKTRSGLFFDALRIIEHTNLGEFRKNLATYGAVKVRYDGDTKGGVETLEITVNADNYKTIVEIFKKALIENAMGYDAKDDRLSGNPNQMNIQSMYSDIDTDANDTESEAQATMDDVLWFINCHLANTGQGDHEGEEVDIIFNRDMLMNESDIIDNCQKSQGIISDETIISMHPWVDDPQLEMERLKKQKEEAQKEMLAQYDPFSTQNQNGDGADDDPDNKGDPSQGSQGGEVDE